MSSELSPRLQDIVRVLLLEKNPMPVKVLAEQIGVSKRTVQRELEYLDRPLKKYGLKFCSKTGSGVWLEGAQEDRERLLGEISRSDSLDVTNRTERRKRLILEILKDKDLKKLYYYSDMFGVSEATISSDLESAADWLAQFDLTIVRKPGYGVSIDGQEKDFRKALRAFIDENMDNQIVRELYEDRNETLFRMVSDKNEKNIYRVLDEEILKRVVKAVLGIQDKRIQNLTENSYTGLIIHVTIAVNRMLKQEIIEVNEMPAGLSDEDEDYQLAGRIKAALEKEFELTIPEEETTYICLHIKGSKVQQVEVDEAARRLMNEPRQLLDTVNEMIDVYDSEVAFALKQDEEFVIQGLIAHLQPTLVRLANGMKIQNPLLGHIRQEYSEIYNRCLEVAKVIERRYGYAVPEAEIGFLAIHFGAAMVRLEGRKESKRKVRIGIVCASGIGISRLMLSKLTRSFFNRVEVQAYGKYDLTPYVLERTDVLVSTIPLTEVEADIVMVSPLLSERDMDAIEQKVRRYERIPLVKQQEEEEEFTRQLEQVNFIAMQIKGIIKEMKVRKVDNGITLEELLMAVSEEASPYHDRQLKIQEDLWEREKLGSQIYPEFGFALLHTRTEGVVKPMFSVFLTKDLGVYREPYFREIGAVIVMLLPRDEHVAENSRILGYLSEQLIEEPDFLDTIMEGEQEQIRALLSRYLKQFFSQYLDKV